MKTKLKLTKYDLTKMERTAKLGYGLFALLVFNTLLSSYFYTTFATTFSTFYFQSTMFFVVLTAMTAILPPLVSYFAGTASTRPSIRFEHHYNGVLMALLSVWVLIVVNAVLNLYPNQLYAAFSSFGNILAPVISLLVILMLTCMYYRVPRQKPLNRFLPYQLALTISIAAFVFLNSVTVMTLANLQIDSVLPIGLATFLAFVTVIWAGYRVSLETSGFARLVDSLIAFSVAAWVATLLSHTLAYVGSTTLSGAFPLTAGLMAWALYLYFIQLVPARRISPKKRR